MRKRRGSGRSGSSTSRCFIMYYCEKQNCSVISVKLHYKRGLTNRPITTRVFRDSIMSKERSKDEV